LRIHKTGEKSNDLTSYLQERGKDEKINKRGVIIIAGIHKYLEAIEQEVRRGRPPASRKTDSMKPFFLGNAKSQK
jgi:hypothetical protein